MLLATLCAIGSCYAFFYYIEDIIARSKKIKTDWSTYHNLVVLTQSLTALIFGVISYFLRKSVNEYIMGIVGAVIGIVGFILCIVANEVEPKLFCWGVFLIAITAGIWWVMPALIAYDDAGPSPFGVLLSMIFVANYWGMSTFGFMEQMFFENIDDPIIATLVCFIIALVVAIIACVAALTMDEK